MLKKISFIFLLAVLNLSNTYVYASPDVQSAGLTYGHQVSVIWPTGCTVQKKILASTSVNIDSIALANNGFAYYPGTREGSPYTVNVFYTLSCQTETRYYLVTVKGFSTSSDSGTNYFKVQRGTIVRSDVSGNPISKNSFNLYPDNEFYLERNQYSSAQTSSSIDFNSVH